jgi:hypothetical protein
MKKFVLFTLIATLFVGTSVACMNMDDDRPIGVEKLPAQIKTFVSEHFAGVDISYAKLDRSFGDDEYEVVLSNGAKIDFNSKGVWKEVDCERTEFPASIIPEKIASYVAQSYPGTKIEKITRSKRYYEVELRNDLELVFDKEFNFLRADD